MSAASSGVSAYKIGTRSVNYNSPAEQAKALDFIDRQVERWCGTVPATVTGRECAIRGISREV